MRTGKLATIAKRQLSCRPSPIDVAKIVWGAMLRANHSAGTEVGGLETCPKRSDWGDAAVARVGLVGSTAFGGRRSARWGWSHESSWPLVEPLGTKKKTRAGERSAAAMKITVLAK